MTGVVSRRSDPAAPRKLNSGRPGQHVRHRRSLPAQQAIEEGTCPFAPERRRAPVAVRVTREGQAWLVIVGNHGWLHGDESSALDDACWLAHNFDLPIRRDEPEGSA
jgi:hypothetical protein